MFVKQEFLVLITWNRHFRFYVLEQLCSVRILSTCNRHFRLYVGIDVRYSDIRPSYV